MGLIGHLNGVRWLVGWMQSSWCALVDEQYSYFGVDIYWCILAGTLTACTLAGTLTSAYILTAANWHIASAYWLVR